jgi:hypothetical protein
MIKRILFFMFLGCMIITSNAYSKTFIGAGPNFLVPIGVLNFGNDKSFGVNLQVESRNYCTLWYGIRFDYYSLAKKNDIFYETKYYKDAFMFSPEVRYLFLGSDFYNGKILPYIQGMLHISSIGGSDEKSRLGLGAALGGGVAFGTTLFGNPCWLFDFNAVYSSPNCIYRDTGRPTLISINASFTISVCF